MYVPDKIEVDFEGGHTQYKSNYENGEHGLGLHVLMVILRQNWVLQNLTVVLF